MESSSSDGAISPYSAPGATQNKPKFWFPFKNLKTTIISCLPQILALHPFKVQSLQLVPRWWDCFETPSTIHPCPSPLNRAHFVSSLPDVLRAAQGTRERLIRPQNRTRCHRPFDSLCWYHDLSGSGSKDSKSFNMCHCSTSFLVSSVVIVPESFQLKPAVCSPSCVHTWLHLHPRRRTYKILYFLISKCKSQDELCTFLPIVDLIWLLHSFWFDCPLWVREVGGGRPMKSLSSLSGRWEGKGVGRFGSQGCGVLSHFKHSSSSVLVFACCISVSDFIWIQGVTVLNVGNSSVGVSITCHCGTAQPHSSSSLVSPQVWKASLRLFFYHFTDKNVA